ncbi:hypothetical protein ACI6PS_07890 [Flavobacterium sp. PLA-1-15]|uniref:hypothetical protein n=1 Tax=Flavobacterium sp. PLA-1-15 TaxID=3380533 RepID=UPI003B7719C4
MIKNKLFLVVFLALLCSCQNSFETVEEMTAYLEEEDNGYRYSKMVNGVDYVLQYKPTDLMVLQEVGDTLAEDKIEKLRQKYGRYLYFTLSMSKNNKELLSGVVHDKQRFGSMVQDLAFEMDQKIHLVSSQKDTLSMVDFVYPRMYGMTNSTTIMVVYPRDEKHLGEQYLNFSIQDLGLNTGEVKFKVATQSLRNQPTLRF